MNTSWSDRLEVEVIGQGPPLVFLHGEDGLLFCNDLIEALAREHTVHCPVAPGWSEHDLGPQQRSVDDLSYLYLDMLESRFDEPVPLVGVSLGAWLALEIGVKRRDVASALCLVSPIGVGVRDDRALDFVDLYAISPSQVDEVLYSAPGVRTRSDRAQELGSDDLLRLARAEQSLAYYAWEPYLRNPQLAGRLHRIKLPMCLVYGTADGLVTDPAYYAKLADLLGPSVSSTAVDGGGHRVFEESPKDVARVVLEFLGAGVTA